VNQERSERWSRLVDGFQRNTLNR